MPFETDGLTLGELYVSQKGAKSVPIKQQGNDCFWSPPSQLSVLFAPSGFNDPEANRVNICFSTDEATEKEIRALDIWVVETILQDPNRYGLSTWTAEQIAERYVSPIRVSAEKGYRSLRAKFNVTGRGACRFWDAKTKEACGMPLSWQTAGVTPRFQIRSLWIMNREYGAVLEMCDCLVDNEAAVCPF